MAKVFDFTDGTKGKQVGDTRTGWGGSSLVEKDGKVFKVGVANNPFGESDDESRWTWRNDAGGTDTETKPGDFGVEAICFCEGEWFHLWHPGHPEAKSHWAWTVLGTTEWNRGACKSGILKATRVRKEIK